jgi:4-amino-4-deoxy-L-arabinose transferase-like glycosyltransferase
VQNLAGAGNSQASVATRVRSVLAWLGYAALAAALVLLAVRSQRAFLSDPPVWPDEALFASPAVDLVQNGTFRTRVLEGLLPSAEHGTYWIPPAYPFVLAGVFALFSSDVAVTRALSFVCALGVLLLVYGLACRLQPSRSLASLAPTLLALDPVFGRGARVGRMDMMALLCVLAAVFAAFDREASARRRALLAGVLAGLGVTVHPIAVLAVPIVLLAELGRPREQRALGTAALGVLLGVSPWLLWIARSPLAFVVQWAAQLIRKGENWQAYGAAPWLAAFEFTLSRYPPALQTAAPWSYLAAFVGLAIASRRNREARVLLGLYALFFVAVLRAAEMWYTLYLTPFLALGVLAVVAVTPASSAHGARARAARYIGGGLVAAVFALCAVRDAADALRWRPAGLAYDEWSERVMAAIPRNARVLIAATPDPYFASVNRPDLVVRELLPAGIPLPDGGADSLLDDTDFVVVGRVAPSEWVLQALRARGRRVAKIGSPSDLCYAQIFALAPRASSGR